MSKAWVITFIKKWDVEKRTKGGAPAEEITNGLCRLGISEYVGGCLGFFRYWDPLFYKC